MMRATWVATVLWLLPAAPAVGQGRSDADLEPGLQVVIHEERYRVEAESLREVIALLNDMRLEGERARLSQGLTVYRIVPRWQIRPDAGSCTVISAEVKVEITVKLPMWPGFATASGDDRLRWQNILEALRTHEYEHRDITIESAGGLVEDLFALRARTCRALNRALDSALVLAEEELRSRHATLDEG